jgi:hypothetical protein
MQNNKFFCFSKPGITALFVFAGLTAISQVVRAEIDGSRTLSMSAYRTDRQLAQGASIEGEWDLDRAQQIISPLLENHNWKWKNSDTTATSIHKILSQHKYPYKKKDARLIVTSSMRQGSDCFACSTELSFFEFEKRNGEWKLVNSFLGVTNWGHYGVADPEGISVKVIGNNGDSICGIMLESSVSHGGSSSSSLDVYTKVGGKLQLILDNAQTSGSNLMGAPKKGRGTNWDSKIAIQPVTSTKGFFNIMVSSKGIREGKSFSEQRIFKFNGQKYVSR